MRSGTEELVEWTRNFARENLVVCPHPPVEQIWEAITTYLGKEAIGKDGELDAAALLEKVLGIAVVVQFGDEQVGWTATADPDTAVVLHQQLSSQTHAQARQALGINSLWILQVNPELLDVYCEEDLIEHAPYSLAMYQQFPDVLHLQERQECQIVEL